MKTIRQIVLHVRAQPGQHISFLHEGIFFATVFLAEQGELFTMNHLSDKFCLFPVGPEIAQVILKLLEANASYFLGYPLNEICE